MLLVKLEASFTKKALGRILFTCEQGAQIDAALHRALETREGQAVALRSVGTNEQGEQVAEFFFTWSFKVRGQPSVSARASGSHGAARGLSS
jgi:hypothetical protein